VREYHNRIFAAGPAALAVPALRRTLRANALFGRALARLAVRTLPA
jgi:hypothetical protein